MKILGVILPIFFIFNGSLKKLKFIKMKTDQLPINEYSKFNAIYIQAVGNVDMIEELEICLHDFIRFVQNIPLDKFDYRYAEGKWTIKDIIQHIIDTERIFTYRALRISRNDKTPLPGFEENDYVANTNANGRSIQDLLAELSAVRQATLYLFKSFSWEQLERIGTASNNEISVRAIGFILIGHQKHHQKVFQERYL
jgi:uncharacterized damage-inducible protein DinB